MNVPLRFRRRFDKHERTSDVEMSGARCVFVTSPIVRYVTTQIYVWASSLAELPVHLIYLTNSSRNETFFDVRLVVTLLLVQLIATHGQTNHRDEM